MKLSARLKPLSFDSEESELSARDSSAAAAGAEMRQRCAPHVHTVCRPLSKF